MSRGGLCSIFVVGVGVGLGIVLGRLGSGEEGSEGAVWAVLDMGAGSDVVDIVFSDSREGFVCFDGRWRGWFQGWKYSLYCKQDGTPCNSSIRGAL